ncbi:uncharacterized protein LOC143036937 isoform X6 [Oratosquilla oratoria]|uniref:uncharacterized protein LOC143036937 isoform X6 n=1 Tax=Oratosquilla oratoria TaxID=337810 RepID=UPI003F76484C
MKTRYDKCTAVHPFISSRPTAAPSLNTVFQHHIEYWLVNANVVSPCLAPKLHPH